MVNKCVAITGKKCYDSLRFLSDEFNMKLLEGAEKEDFTLSMENPFSETVYNPFGKPAYFVWIKTIDLNRRYKNFKIRNVTPKIYFKRLVRKGEFEQFSTQVTYDEFVNFFLYEDKFNTWEFKKREYSKQILRTPPMIKIDYPFKKETFLEYIERCREKFKTDFIYDITLLIESTKEVEFEYQELPSKDMLKDNPNLPPIRIWKQTEKIPDDRNLAYLKSMVLDLCNCFEANGIYNYKLSSDTAAFDMDLEMQLDADLSWGDYNPHE